MCERGREIERDRERGREINFPETMNFVKVFPRGEKYSRVWNIIGWLLAPRCTIGCKVGDIKTGGRSNQPLQTPPS